MVTIIESNIIKYEDKVLSVQSRVIQADSWKEYRSDMINEISVSYTDIIGSNDGFTLPLGPFETKIELDDDNSLLLSLYREDNVNCFQKLSYLCSTQE